MEKKKLGAIWKEDKKWKIQMPHGILTFNTKKIAEAVKLAFELGKVNK